MCTSFSLLQLLAQLMEPAKSTENLAPKMTSDNSRIHLMLIVISMVIAVVALIVSCVGLSMKGTTNVILPESSASTGPQSGALGKLCRFLK